MGAVRRAVFRTAALVALVLLGLGCHDEAKAQQAFLSSLSAELRRLSASERGGDFDLAAITQFDWDRFYVFPAYSWPELVNRELGFIWVGGAKSATLSQDRYQLLVFVKGQRVVLWADYDPTDGDFQIGKKPITKAEALLQVVKEEDGVSIVRLGTIPPKTKFVHYNSKGQPEEVSPEMLGRIQEHGKQTRPDAAPGSTKTDPRRR